jgi:optic atrophy protein 1
MSSFKYIGVLLRLRYIVPATAVGGYYSAKHKIEEIKSSMPELPDFLQDLHVGEHLTEFKDYLKEGSTSLTSSLTDFINKTNEQYLAAKQEIERKNFVEKEKISADQIVKPIQDTSSVRQNTTNSQKPSDINKQQAAETAQNRRQEEVVAIRRELERLRKENRELKSAIRSSGASGGSNSNASLHLKRKIKKSLIEIYSEVLDELSGYDSAYKMQDHLPKVVVVGDQSSGKTSVLEMIAGARIFPRGAGEMMTRAPVQVTLSEGPYHVARFKDSPREYDLTKETELAELRHEIEARMRRSVQDGKTVSNQVISLSIQGPGIQRMVLVDLPGIISTVTTELAPDTKECIKKMVLGYMGNPNAIILCIQDGSIDAERSIFTDMVSEIDHAGKRTILVLTKVDIAEKTHANPAKIKKILDGELFPMKAMGYYAVVAGKSGTNSDIQEIKDYEEKFFSTSTLLDRGILNPSQCSTRNLSLKVSECFWSMVRESVEQQADAYKATLFNLEAEWQRLFPHVRQLTRDEVFHNARNELLDEIAQLSRLSTKDWDQLISSQLWNRVHEYVIEKLYFPAAIGKDHFSAKVDMDLQRWIESTELPKLAMEVAKESIKQQFNDFLFKDQKEKKNKDNSASASGDRIIYQDLKKSVLNDALDRYQWKNQALEILRVVQLEAISKQITLTKENWIKAIGFLEECLMKYIDAANQELTDLTGLGFTQRWLKWQSTTHEQRVNSIIRSEFDRLVATHESVLDSSELSEPDLLTIRRSLEAQGYELDTEAIQRVWTPYHKHNFLQNEVERARECGKMFHFYENGLDCETDCNHVLFFYRIKRMLEFSTNSLRRQFLEGELRRINKEIMDVLDEYSEDDVKKAKLISGKRVELAEELVKVRQIQDKLDEFITALNQEESAFTYNGR